MVTEAIIGPGPSQPYPPGDADALADLLDVDCQRVVSWCARGMPQQVDGRFEPISCCAWVAWEAIDEAPTLRRRWQRWQALFAPMRDGREQGQRLRWLRRHRLYLPGKPCMVSWWLPRPMSRSAGQVLEDEDGLVVDAIAAQPEAGLLRLDLDAPGPEPTAIGRCDLRLAPLSAPAQPDVVLEACMAELVSTWRYEFRRHHPGEDLCQQERGSCLDLALELARRLADLGRPSRLQAGLIAADAVANAHYWLEVEGPGQSWLPLDPTPAAVARMLGQDFRPWLRPWCGGCDARRILLWSGPPPPHLADRCRFPSPVPGLVVLAQGDGPEFDGWPCLDWACGRTDAAFITLP